MSGDFGQALGHGRQLALLHLLGQHGGVLELEACGERWPGDGRRQAGQREPVERAAGQTDVVRSRHDAALRSGAASFRGHADEVTGGDFHHLRARSGPARR